MDLTRTQRWMKTQKEIEKMHFENKLRVEYSDMQEESDGGDFVFGDKEVVHDTPRGSSPVKADNAAERIEEELVDGDERRSEINAKTPGRAPAEKRKAPDEHDDAPGTTTTVRNANNQTDEDDSAMTAVHDPATTRNTKQQRQFEEEVRRAARILKRGAPMSSVGD